MFGFMFKSLRAHKARLLLTSVAVLLGVSLVTGTYVFTDTISSLFDDLTTNTTQGIDVYVRGESTYAAEMSWGSDREPVPTDVLYTVRGVPGARWAFGNVGGFAAVLGRDGKVIRNGASPTLGMSWSPPPLGSTQLESGRPPTTSTEVVLDLSTYEAGGFSLGDPVTIAVNGPTKEYEVVGTVSYGTANNLAGATMAVFDLAEAQRAFDKEGVFDAIEVAGEPGLDGSVLRQRIAAALPSGFEAIPSAEMKAETDEVIGTMIGYFNTALLVFALIALFVGAFIIFNTFSIIVAQRLREFALLRSLGASSRQVTIAVATEALIVGLVASVLGIAAGVGVALGLKSLLAGFGMDLPTGGLELLPRTVIVSLVLGTGVTLVSAVAPSRRAARVPPLAVVRAAELSGATSLTRRSVIGASLSVAGIGALALGLFADVAYGLAFVGAGALALFLGVAALSPLITRPVVTFLGYLPARLAGLSGTLARENSRRKVRRTATTAAALMIGVALVSFVAIFSASLKASTSSNIAAEMIADLVVQEEDAPFPLGMSPALAEELRELPEVGSLTPMRSGEFGYRDSPQFVAAVDPVAVPDLLDLRIVEGSLDGLRTGGILIETTAAENFGLEVGDRFPMEFGRTGTVDSTVSGIFEGEAALETSYLVGLDFYEHNFAAKLDMRVFLSAAPGVSESALRDAVDGVVADYPGIGALDAQELQDAEGAQIDQLLGLITALLALALIIAIIGIANTLGLSILERTRELGLLRAVGMTRRQLRRMIRLEAVIIAVFGAGLGLIVGTLFGWSVTSAMGEEGLSDIAIPWLQLGIYLVLGAVAGVTAAMLPARRASKLDVLQAITVE
jgi:putative ABC transport system permease protein